MVEEVVVGEAPGLEEMTARLQETVGLAQSELSQDEVAALAAVMKAMCLSLTDIDARFYVVFADSAGASFALDDPGCEPMLTITTTAQVFDRMAMGEANPAVELAMRKVKMGGVPVTRLAKVGGNLIDTLFRCYREACR